MSAKVAPTYRSVTARVAVTASVTVKIPSPHAIYDHMSVEALIRRARDAIQPLLLPAIVGAKAKLIPFGIVIDVQNAKVEIEEG